MILLQRWEENVVDVLAVVAILRAASASATSGSAAQPCKLHELAATLSAISPDIKELQNVEAFGRIC
jgi:hypothetical protein